MSQRVHKKVLIKIGYTCNNRCVFCHARGNMFYPDLKTQSVFQKIRCAKEAGMEVVVFSGGEATIRKDFFTLIKNVKMLGMKFGVVTNGRMFSYKNFAHKFLQYKPEYIYLSLHGAVERTHNALTNTISFKQVLSGLRNISGKIPYLTINVVVTKMNLKELKNIVDLILPFSPLRLKFSFVEPKGAVLENFNGIVPDIATAAKCINDVFEYGEKAAPKGISFSCDGFVPCLIKNYNFYNGDLFTDNFVYMMESFENKFVPVDFGERCFLPPCFDCVYKKLCPGLYKEYIKYFSKVELKPKLHPVPNGLNYFLRGVFKAKENACPIDEMLIKQLDPLTDISVLHKDKILLYQSDEENIPHLEINEIKKRTEQVYLDISFSKGIKNFESDMLKLNLLPVCRKCVYLERCTAIYKTSFGNVYSESEEKIKNILEKLSGNILDVGCGQILYKDLFNNLIHKKQIQYIGVDPVLSSSNTFTIHRSAIEDFKWQKGYFDTVLVLRSYNHFSNLKKAFNTIFNVLKTDGEIIIVENTAYALLRADENIKENSSLKYEHYRNHTSYDALDFLHTHNKFVVLDHLPLSPDCGNQWLLKLSKKSTILYDNAYCHIPKPSSYSKESIY